MVYIVSNGRVRDSGQKKVLQHLEDRNLHNSLKFFMVYAQICGLFPINCSATSYSELEFKWRSFRVVYNFLMICLTSIAVFGCFYKWFAKGYVFMDLAFFVFYVGSVSTLILFLRLSKRWSKLMTTWCKMDKSMNERYGYPTSLDKRLRMCSAIFLSLAIIDYCLSIYSRYRDMVIAYGDKYDYKYYFVETFPQLYLVLPVNVVTATYCGFINTHATLLEAFTDLFIILMSITLALRFKQITKRLEENFSKFQMKNEEFWIEIREDYDRLSMLCKELDDNISYIILLSYTINLFFLLSQLYQSLEVVSGVIGKIYFVFSFVNLIFKIVCVSLYGAWINDESKEPANILNSVSSSCYNVEVRRLLMQISFDNVALTGCRMFKITRGIILSIAGAVVTYELVLIQFNSATQQ